MSGVASAAGRRDGSKAGGGEDLPMKLDDSAWSIVHGSRESLDFTSLPTPTTADLHFYNTQGLTPSPANDGSEEEAGFSSWRRMVEAALQQAAAAAAAEEGDEGVGFQGGREKKRKFSMEDANTVSIITERVSDTEQRLWTSGFKNVMVFRQTAGSPELELLARYDHGGFDFHYHGSYAFVGRSADGAPVYVVAIKEKIYRFTLTEEEEAAASDSDSDSGSDSDSDSDDEEDEIKEEKEKRSKARQQRERLRYRLVAEEPLRVFGGEGSGGEDNEKNYIVGVTLSEDGTVVVASKGGNVTALRETREGDDDNNGGTRTLRPVNYLPLSRYVGSSAPIHISNSISVHQQGVYIVTQEELVRLDVDPASASLEFRWATRYGRGGLPWYTSRLGPGSGSTPTITRCLGRDVVVITDGELGMSLVYLDAETGEELARAPVDFGEGVDAARLTSEQSVAVRGCQAFVVNNYVGTGGLDEDTYCTYAPTPRLKQGLADFCNMLQPEFISKVCPAVFGCVGFGAAMYTLEEAQGGFAVARQWARDDVSCGTSIPLIADPPGGPSTTYCIGMPRGGTRWQLLAFDTDSGEDRFRFGFYPEGKDRAKNFFANPYYAGVEAVGGSALAVGSIGGVIYLTPNSTKATLLSASASASAPNAHPAHGSAAPSAVLGLAGAIAACIILVAAAVAALALGGARSPRRRQSPATAAAAAAYVPLVHEEDEEADQNEAAVAP